MAYSEKFLRIHSRTAKSEGGFQKNPDDNGNWTGGKKGVGVLIGTNWGISAPMLCTWLKRTATEADMRALKKETSLEIYHKVFWLPIKGDQILKDESTYQVYDMAVNGSVETAIKMLQGIYNLEPTGVMNQATLNRINNVA